MKKSLNDIKAGDTVVIDGVPYIVLSAKHLHMQQRKANVSIRVKNLIGGNVIEKTYRSDQELEEAELERKDAVFLYEHHGVYWFADASNPKERFSLNEAVVGSAGKFLKQNLSIAALAHNGAVINIILPIKVEYIVTEAPPAIKGSTAQGGTKQIIIESGAKLSVPMFINKGDSIRVNTQTGEYVERTEKGA